MHRHRRFRHGPRGFRPWMPFGGVIWVFLLAFLFMGGRWWPGILALILLASLFGLLFRDTPRQGPQNPPPVDFPMQPPAPAAPPASIITPAPEPSYRAELLPAACPQCGGPIQSHEVKWTGQQSAVCPYCGSNLLMKEL